MSKNIARLAVTAGLTAALSFGGVMAPVTMAFAEGNTTVTFNDPDYAASTTYKGIQIFKAKVTKDNGTTSVSGIEWAGTGTEIQTAVVNAIKKKDNTYSSDNAQDAADWLSANAEGTGTGSKVASDNVFSLIAANLKDSTAWQKTTKGDASLSKLDAGYWLFLTDNAGKPDGKSTDAFTSPVYAVIDGTNTTVTITPKKSIPTVNKQILAATSADPTKLTTGWAGVANSQIGQEVTYKLTGKVADNYATYDSYAYKFTDTLSNGLDYVSGSLKVYAVNNGVYTPINSGYDLTTPTEDNRVLTVNFAVDKATGKKGLKDIAFVNADTEIVVFYNAKLNKNAVTGNGTEGKGGNYNAVKLEYSNNPYTEGTGTSVEGGAGDFTFKLNLNKVDQGTEKGLEGAVFTIKSADSNTAGQYVASRDAAGVVAGQLVTVADANKLPGYVKFTSDKDGKIPVSGLDAGSYTVTEVQTPDDTKYTKAEPFTFTIKAEYKDNAAELEKITVSPSENDEHRSDVALGTLNNTPGDNTLTATNGTAANVETGEINITVGNTKSVGLPLTGLNGVTFTWIAGGAVLCIGVAHLIRSRKQAEESEQE
ncbi:MAG: isopeptide-forming domain-containing fimbrial protein [Collinsella sp.]